MKTLVAGSCTLNEVDNGTCDLAAIGWPGAVLCIVLTLAVAAVLIAFFIGLFKQ